MPKTKICKLCGKELPATLEYYYKSKSGKYGLQSKCKECYLKYQKEYIESNPERRKETRRKYDDANREAKNEHNKKYRAYNKEHLNQKAKERRLERHEEVLNKEQEYREKRRLFIRAYNEKYRASEKAKETKRKYYQSPKGKEMDFIKHHKRSALKKELEFNYDIQKWEDCLKYFNHKCAYCGKEKPLEQDHFIPISKYGEYTINNIVPACKSCNSSKNNKDFFEWYPSYIHYSKARKNKILKYLNYNNQIQQLALSI